MQDRLLIIAVIGTMILATVVLSLTIGGRIAERSTMVAGLTSGLLPSAVLVLVASLIYVANSDRPGDGPIMALAGSFIYAVLAAPFTAAVAFFLVWRRRPRRP